MIEKIIVVAPTTAVPISTGLAVALNVLPAPSFSSSRCLARSKFTSKLKSLLELRLNVRNLLDQRQLENRLRVVRHRAIGIDRDGDRAHAQESERHQTKREHRRRQQSWQLRQSHRADVVADPISANHRQTQPVGGEIAGHEARQNTSDAPPSCAEVTTSSHVPRFGRSEHLHQFRNDRAGQRAAGDDGRQLPPQRARHRPGRES